MFMRPLRLCLALALSMSATPLLAQQVELAPLVGVYSPTTDFKVNALPPFTGLGEATAKQETGLLFGGLARVWLDHRIGFQLSAGRISSDLNVAPPFSPSPDTSVSSRLTIVSLTGLVRFPISDLSNSLWIEAGAASINRSGRAFEGYDGTSSLGGVVGLGTGLRLSDRLRADIGFRGLIYQMNLRDAIGPLSGGTQVDLMAHAGLSLWLGAVED